MLCEPQLFLIHMQARLICALDSICLSSVHLTNIPGGILLSLSSDSSAELHLGEKDLGPDLQDQLLLIRTSVMGVNLEMTLVKVLRLCLQ